MRIFKTVIFSILAIIIFIALAFVLELGGLKWKRFFSPRHENVRRDVFEATRSYNQAKIQELAKYKLEYETTQDEGAKMVLANFIRHKFADYNDSKLPYGLKAFLVKIRGY